MKLNPISLLGHASYILMALAFLVRDIILLRLLTIIAALLAISYFSLAPRGPDWLVVFWQLYFIVVNIVWIILLKRERRSIKLSEEEAELYETVFKAFSPVEFLKLMRLAEWADSPAGETLCRAGEPVTHLMMIYNGAVEIQRPDGRRPVMKDGGLLGEMSYISGGPASATAETLEPTRYLRWSKEALKGLLRRNPSMSTAMQTVFSSELARKLAE